jgi:hypothetical protein
MTPVVCVPAPISDTAKPAMRAKLPSLAIGKTMGVFVNALKCGGGDDQHRASAALLVAGGRIE